MPQKHISAKDFFHKKPENLNCAQSILKAYQKEFDISDSEIESFRALGGGRAEGGVCGALFAAEQLLREKGLESIAEEFKNESGSTICRDIKKSKESCEFLVNLADELIQKRLRE